MKPHHLYADSQAAIKHADSEGVTARTKLFDARLKHSRDLQHKGIFKFTYTKPSGNTNMFIKGLPAPAHRRHVGRLGLTEAASGAPPMAMRRD